MSGTINQLCEHREVSELIPWYVNARIGEADRQRVEAHLRDCTECRGELQLQRQVHAAMTADPGIEYMPTASLKRLQARLDGQHAAPDAAPDAARENAADRPAHRSMRWGGSMAASIAVMAVAIGILAAGLWTRYQERARPLDYFTVTTATPHPPQEAIRAVFAPQTTLVELQSILDEAQLRIISGPSEAGVYSLAANSSLSVSASLGLLRAHAAVRFAEASGPAAASDHSQ
jgi:anti-sigma factor RsiW